MKEVRTTVSRAQRKATRAKISESQSFHQKVVSWVATIALAIGLVMILYPLLWMFSTALKSDSEVMINTGLIPQAWAWDNFAKAWNSAPFTRYLLNTLFITGLSLVGNLLSNTLVAYGFARLRFKGRDTIFLAVLGTMMIPYMVTMVPAYVLFSKIGWVGTYLPLIVPTFTGGAYNIFLIRQNFLGLSSAYAEAAKIEGAGELTILRKIYVPLCRPVLMTVAVFTFNGKWNDYFSPMLYLTDEKMYTLQLGLRTFRGTAGVEWQKFMAASLIVLAPSVVIYFFLQKYIISSVAVGGVKG